ncbi:aminoglycoside phosphotransferase family protein [Paenibacillus sp. p3-SID867]|uniref:aminoglycoside phosphotransferase family protein n=1 Tax=Paenibacillus sp. p3-SID867 TaxID=2916363 RepID=UPI0021A8C95D|nr:aminoglycoside phosphotransferase family protein [Paenibacillus sp. p3-SID867]MCT1400829.1 aminoglycoside phosphotransferase family protein [Paenibacillus sp. p3-SID867]
MEQLQGILKEYYGLDRTHVVPQKGGWAALAYKVQSERHAYFLKVYEKSRASTPKWTALIDDYVPVLLWLEEHSRLKGKIPVPILTKDGCYQCEDDEGIYLLYEYIVGDTIADTKLTKDQVRQLAEMIAELHRYGEEVPLVTSAMKESFTVPFLEQLRSTLDGELPYDLGKVLLHHIDSMKKLMLKIEELSEALKNRDLRMALCHTDVHGWNLMSTGQLKLIDWEGLKLAPVEADMMSFVDEPYFSEFMRIYANTHSHYEVNIEALTFYQGRRKLEDVWEFMEQLLYDEQNDEERTSTLNSLRKELEGIMP